MTALRQHPSCPASRARWACVRGRRGGFTLAEVMIASVLLLVITLALAEALSVGQSLSYGSVEREKAVTAAESMLDRVLALPYDDPDGGGAIGPDSGESGEADFDNIDDYDGYAEAPGSLADATGAALPDGYQGLARSVSVVAESVSVSALGGSRSGVTVTVAVTLPGGQVITLNRWAPEP